MLLRRSGEISEESYNLSGVMGDAEVGVEDEDLLVSIAEAVFAGDPVDLARMRAEAIGSIGAEKFVDAIGIASGFNGITKVANATGIPLDTRTEEVTASLRQQIGIDDYSESHKTNLYG